MIPERSVVQVIVPAVPLSILAVERSTTAVPARGGVQADITRAQLDRDVGDLVATIVQDARGRTAS